jgi:hypothetical protein
VAYKALKYEDVYGKRKPEEESEEGSSSSKPFSNQAMRNDDVKLPDHQEGDTKMTESKYIVQIDGFTEKGARHLKGDVLKVAIDEDRAKALLNAGYIALEEVKTEAPVEKAMEAPIKKVITSDEAEKKTVTGKGAGLLKGKKK